VSGFGFQVSGVRRRMSDVNDQMSEAFEGGSGNRKEFGSRPPARRGHRGLRPGGKSEWGMRNEGAEGMGQVTDIRVQKTEYR